MWTWLLILTPVVAIAVLVWNYRRQAAAREVASAERMKAFLGKAATDAKADPAGSPLSAAPMPDTPAVRGVRAQPQAVSGFASRAQLLNAEQLAIYRLLKSALPEYEVFPQMSLSSFIQPAENLTGFAREAQMRRLADTTVDFLVCDRSMKPVATAQCGARTGKAAENAAFAAACVASTGVRWVEFSPGALPSFEGLRTWVLGA